MLKIPEELKKQGVRRVEVKDSNNKDFDKRILIGEIFGEKRFICVKAGYEEEFLKGKEFYETYKWRIMKEIPEPKEPQKIPYTAETFPENAVWIRKKGTEERLSYEIKKNVHGSYIIRRNNGYNSCLNEVELMEGYEIGCLTKDAKLEWRNFYQIKE